MDWQLGGILQELSPQSNDADFVDMLRQEQQQWL